MFAIRALSGLKHERAKGDGLWRTRCKPATQLCSPIRRHSQRGPRSRDSAGGWTAWQGPAAALSMALRTAGPVHLSPSHCSTKLSPELLSLAAHRGVQDLGPELTIPRSLGKTVGWAERRLAPGPPSNVRIWRRQENSLSARPRSPALRIPHGMSLSRKSLFATRHQKGRPSAAVACRPHLLPAT